MPETKLPHPSDLMTIVLTPLKPLAPDIQRMSPGNDYEAWCIERQTSIVC